MKTLKVKDVRKQLAKALKDISKLNDNLPFEMIDITDDYRFCEGLVWGQITGFNLHVEKFINDDGKPVMNLCVTFSAKPLDDELEEGW